eukprot:SAG22_NODE_307_length_12666_cov_761.250259_9_plen_543_part_00
MQLPLPIHSAEEDDERDAVIGNGDDDEDNDEVARLHEFHQPLPSGLVAVMISRCTKACGPDTQIWRQAVRTSSLVNVSGPGSETVPVELLVCLDGVSRVVIWAQCPAGGHQHRLLLERVAVFERIIHSVACEQWPGCSSTVSCFVPSAGSPKIVPLITCELALARAETSITVDGTVVQLATMLSGDPPPMGERVRRQLATLRFFRDIPAALDELLDLPQVADFTAAVDAELVANMAGRPWSSVLGDARDMSGLLGADALDREEKQAAACNESPALSLLTILGRIHDNSHLLQPVFSTTEAVCDHILGSFEWLEAALRERAAEVKLTELPALECLFEPPVQSERSGRSADQQPKPEQEPLAVEVLPRLFDVLPMEQREHDVFITHAQATGQDQCKTLCMLLQQQGKKVWYDMQAVDLTAEGMERGVSQSRAVLIFLSDGYFTRPFCVKELRWAKLYGCALLGVVEKDSRHHAADFGLEAQRAPADLEHVLADDEFLEYQRRNYLEKAMVEELGRRFELGASESPQPAHFDQSPVVDDEPQPEL